MRLRSGLVLLLALAGCAPDARVSSLAIRDPLALIDDVYASGNTLRLVVLPGEAYPCDSTSGNVTGWGDAQDDAPIGMAGDPIVDVSLARDETIDHMVTVPAGAWTVLVRGRGDASGLNDVIIATGCSAATVEAGGTIEVSVLLAPVTVTGTCGDAVLSSDEQCEGGPNCTDCRTTPEEVNNKEKDGVQSAVRVASRTGQRTVAIWNDPGFAPGGMSLRFFDSDARSLAGMGPLEFDATSDEAGLSIASVQNTGSIAVAPDGRIAIAFTDISMTAANGPDVRVAFFSPTRTVQGTHQLLRADSAGAQGNAAIAISGGGATMVVFEDAQSSTGLSGRVIAMGSTTPSGTEAFEVGAGRTGGSAPAIAGTASGFVVAFAAGGDVWYQRFGADGTPTDATAQSVAPAGGARSTPSVGVAGDGSFLVAWAEVGADSGGSGIRARIVAAGGAPLPDVLDVNTTEAGDQTRPAVAASDNAFLIAFESAGSVRAAGFTSGGDRALNREQPPTFADFEVAAGAAQPSVTVVGSGAERTWWIAYQAGDDIFARRFPL